MTTKQWLSRAKRIDEEIDSLIQTRDETLSRIMSITQSYTAMPVQSTKDPHKFDRLAGLEFDIDRKVDELIEVKREILSTIHQISDRRYRLVLMKRYIDYKTFEKIAVEMHYSYKQVCRLHGRALIEMEGKLHESINSL